MSRSQSSSAQSSLDRSVPAAETAMPVPADTAAKLTTDLSQVNPMPSPALDLQQNLRNAWAMPTPGEETAAGDRKIPAGWALTAVLVGCGAVWACIALVVF